MVSGTVTPWSLGPASSALQVSHTCVLMSGCLACVLAQDREGWRRTGRKHLAQEAVVGVSGGMRGPPGALPVPCPGQRFLQQQPQARPGAALAESMNVTQGQRVTGMGTENGISGRFG